MSKAPSVLILLKIVFKMRAQKYVFAYFSQMINMIITIGHTTLTIREQAKNVCFFFYDLHFLRYCDSEKFDK